ncbi:MAG: DUF4279 domain-containing protein [Planktomarina sp.]
MGNEMGCLKHSSASLRIRPINSDDEFNPDQISRLMGIQPTHVVIKGAVDSKRSARLDREVISQVSQWSFRTAKEAQGDLNNQVFELLSPLPKLPKIWDAIHQEFCVDIFCGLWLSGDNSGVALEPATLRLLADLSIPIDFDIYRDTDFDRI